MKNNSSFIVIRTAKEKYAIFLSTVRWKYGDWDKIEQNHLMGCIHVRVKPEKSVERNDSIKSRSTASQENIIQNSSNELNKSKTYPVTKHKKSRTVSKPLVVTHKSNNDRDSRINKPLTESDGSIPLRNGIINSTSIDSKRTSISPLNTPDSVDMDSTLSDIPEVSSVTITSSELDQISACNDPIISSSSDLKHKRYCDDAINRYLSTSGIQFNSQQASAHSNIWNESDHFYSLRHAFVTPISPDSDESPTDRPKAARTVSVQSRKSNIQHKTFSNEASGESDESSLHHVVRNNSAVKDVKRMTDHLVTVSRSTPTRLSDPDDQSKRVINEPTSELDK